MLVCTHPSTDDGTWPPAARPSLAIGLARSPAGGGGSDILLARELSCETLQRTPAAGHHPHRAVPVPLPPQHQAASRPAGGLIVPRGRHPRGGGRQPWSSPGLAGRTTPRRSRCDGAASGALETSRQRRLLHFVAALRVSQSPPAAGTRPPAGDGPPPVNQGVLTWLPSAPSPSVRTAATKAN